MCPRGFYSAAGATVCTECEAGYACPNPYASEKLTCTDGYYSARGSLNCYPVPSHMMTSATSARPYMCEFRHWSMLASSACAVCPLDSYCPADNINPVTCPMSVEDGTISAYTSREGEQSCFPRLGGRTGVSADYAGSSSSSYDNLIVEGYYTHSGGTVQYECPFGR